MWIISDLCKSSEIFHEFSSLTLVLSLFGKDPKELKFTYKISPLKNRMFSALKSKILLALKLSSNISQKFSFYYWKYKLLI